MILVTTKIIQEKGVFYYVYPEIFTRRTCSCGGNGRPCHTHGALLLYRNEYPIRCLCGGMVRLPVRHAVRSRQDLSVNCGGNRLWAGVDLYKNKEVWSKLMHRAATTDFSWKNSAKKYEALYLDMLK